ncbi:MAG: hypothetical protein AAGF11_48125 [Myxococcota bacterium]
MQTLDEERAIKYAGRCALAAGMLPSTFRRTVERTETSSEGYRRAAYQIERRRIELAFGPGHGTKKMDAGPLPDGSGLDPWRVDPGGLPSDTVRTSVCPTCAGNKKVVCATCGGSSRVGCASCGGSGRVPGQRGMKNCPSCRGHGMRNCGSCRSGLVKCHGCEGLGRVRAWLELRTQQIGQIKAHPTNGVAALHHGLLTAEDLNRQPDDYRNAQVADSGWTEGPPDGLSPELRASLDPVTDRVVGCRVQDFSATVVRIHYRTALSRGIVAVAGHPLGTLPETTWTPLRRRATLALVAGGLMFVAAMMLLGAYMERAPWFHEHGNAGPLALLGLAQALVSAWLCAGVLLPRSARTAVAVKVPLGMLLSVWALMAALWFIPSPSVDGVERSIERGDLVAARVEAEAVEAEEGSFEALGAALDRIDALEAAAKHARHEAVDQEHLDRIRAARSVAETARQADLPWYFSENRKAAVALVRERTIPAIDRAYANADAKALAELARVAIRFDPPLAQRAEARAMLVNADSCRQRDDFACAVSALRQWDGARDDPKELELHDTAVQQVERDLHAHLQNASVADVAEDSSPTNQKVAIERLLEESRLYEKFAQKESPLDRAALDKQMSVVERRIQRDARKAERARKRAEQEQRRRERAAARASRPNKKRRAPAPSRSYRGNHVQCCDGTTSPTCTYDRASLRGCCSHHGGVC